MSAQGRSKKTRGSDDMQRCAEVGHRVLKGLEALDAAGVENPQAQVYGREGNERVMIPNHDPKS